VRRTALDLPRFRPCNRSPGGFAGSSYRRGQVLLCSRFRLLLVDHGQLPWFFPTLFVGPCVRFVRTSLFPAPLISQPLLRDFFGLPFFPPYSERVRPPERSFFVCLRGPADMVTFFYGRLPARLPCVFLSSGFRRETLAFPLSPSLERHGVPAPGPQSRCLITGRTASFVLRRLLVGL